MCRKVGLGLKHTNPDLRKCNEPTKRYGTTIDAIINTGMIEQTGEECIAKDIAFALDEHYSIHIFTVSTIFCKIRSFSAKVIVAKKKLP